MTGGRPVDDHEVVLARALDLFHFSQHEQVVDTGRRGGHHVEHAAALETVRQAAELAFLQVVDQRLLGRDRAGREGGGTAGRRPDDAYVVAEVVATDQQRQAAAALDLDHECVQSTGRGRHGEGSRYRRFADPALPGHDHEPRTSEELLWIHDPPRRRFVRRLPTTTIPAPRRSARRRWAFLALSLVGAVTSLTAQAATAADDTSAAPVDVVEVSGFIDKPVADNIERAIARASTDGAQALVLQLNSKRATVSRARMDELARAIADSPVLVAIWVGPAGSPPTG